MTKNHQTEDQLIITKDGLEKLKNELSYLKGTRRREIAERLKEAISYGDLSENSEYEEAKNEQAFMEGRIMELEHMVKTAKVVDESQHSKNTVEIGTLVELERMDKKQTLKLTIVGATEADPFASKISIESPLGVAVTGSKVGDVVRVDAPEGAYEVKVVKLS